MKDNATDLEWTLMFFPQQSMLISAASNIEWSGRPELNFDPEQTTAFQIATAAFVLSYYIDARGVSQTRIVSKGSLSPAVARSMFTSERKRLMTLARLSQSTPHL